MDRVTDQRAALRELRRVTRPGGRVIVSTNVYDGTSRLRTMHDAAARELGYVPAPAVLARFHAGHLPLAREVFPNAVHGVLRRRRGAAVTALLGRKWLRGGTSEVYNRAYAAHVESHHRAVA